MHFGFYIGMLLLTGSALAAAPPDLLPHSRPGAGQHDIRQAWLVAPTERYRHGVLGDALEAAGLEVALADGERLRVELEADVFEDLQPRVGDLDNDRQDEIILVRSSAAQGARLSVWGVRGGQLVELAHGPWIGRPQRWLNPIGAADFDGDGRQEIAYVQTPHIGGRLRIFEYRRGQLQEEYHAEGFSNHALGDTDLSLHRIGDFDGDGTADLKVPDAGRSHWRVMSIRQGQLVELRREPH
jgi:hypothetical protein